MAIKAFAFDMDGTLLDSKHKISNENLEAIKKAKDKGYEIILASGRAPMRMVKFAQQVGARYIVCFNGSIVMDLETNKVLKQERLTEAQAKEVYDYSKKQNVGLIAYVDGIPHTRRKGIFSRIIGESQGMKIQAIPREEIKYADKMVIGSLRKGKVREMAAIAKSLFTDMEVFQPNSRSVEFCPKGVNKAAGLSVLAPILKLSPNEFMCFGDGGNDSEMFKWSQNGIAMGNAMSELVKYSIKQIGDNNTSDIAKVILETINK